MATGLSTGLWTVLDADSKLIVSWRLGPRDLATAYDFTHDLAERVSQRVQITTDGLHVYLEAVESAFWEDVDYAMLQKVYGNASDGRERDGPAVRRVRHRAAARSLGVQKSGIADGS